jgi:alkanesulfonate monooxygenase SsuD/methylene tetrahydromethanopterin reductase-like flavin-dependent oxidoreductase (luciferase family)
MPIMIGTFLGERMMKLTAQHADHWNMWAQSTGNCAPTTAPLQRKMDEICESVGRDPRTLERSVAVLADFPGAYGRPGQAVPSLTGSPQEMAEEFRNYAAAGVSHIQIYPDPCTVEAIEMLAPVLEILDES